ncbi:hypothetical protein MKX01_031164 [Papaver californicum]|nr:hypothetical protein MKX01_031164 [Papaver californicum]
MLQNIQEGSGGKDSAAISGTTMRPDLKTLKKASCDLKCFKSMRHTKKILFPLKQIGAVPGIDVRDHFLTRCEMVCCLGYDLSTVLPHHASYIVNDASCLCQVEERYRNCTFPLAVSVVLSGKYEDNLDKGDDVIYIGQGGNDYKGKCKQTHNQVMARGNLALKNNYEQDVSVRLIRGHTSEEGKPGKTYTYDGLYKVVLGRERCFQIYCFKFHLKRLEGQPPLTTKQVTYCKGHVPERLAKLHGLVCNDISGGEEAIPIPATNLIDPPLAPKGNLDVVDEFSEMHAGFKYCKSMKLAKNVKLPVRASGCGCEGTCTNPKICHCAKLNGVDFQYVSRDGGRLVMPKSIVYECGPLCGCGDGCANKSSQRGIKYLLEVFRTPNKGWAVTMHGLDGRERRIGDAAASSLPHTQADKEQSESARLDKVTDEDLESKTEFCIDAGKVGNVARFINHSFDGNLFIQSVLSSHEDVKLSQLMLFASENIPPLQELTYDYGYEVDSVFNADGSIRVIVCHCNAADCRKRIC